MDPNLAKMISVNLTNIQRGHSDRVLAQAKDYLSYILGHNHISASREFREFRRNVRDLEASACDS